MEIIGYGDRLSAAPGETVEFKISSRPTRFRAEVVRLLRGGAPGRTPPLVEEPVAHPAAGEYPGRWQPAYAGSYVRGALGAPRTVPGWTADAWIWPTTPGRPAPQAIVTCTDADGRPGLALALTASGVSLLAGTTVLAATGVVPHERTWCRVTASLDADGAIVLTQAERGGAVTRVTARAASGPSRPVGGVLAGTLAEPGTTDDRALFNGKIARPAIYPAALSPDEVSTAPASAASATGAGGAEPLVAWDFSVGQHGTAVTDRGPYGVAGTCVNLPARGVTGPDWTGAETDFRRAPGEYDAIHFHDDDLADAAWDTDVALTVPGDLPSGVYALKVTAGDDTDRIPLVVREPPEAPHAPVLVLLPTWTYLAYANWRTYVEEAEQRAINWGEARGYDPVDEFLVAHPEYGKSLYDHHSDGSGVFYSSRLRPIVNMRPTYFTPTTKWLRHFAADLQLIWWLERRGVPYAVATDDDLHDQGVDLLSRHRVVITGSHPEYHSGAMLDALAAYRDSGGRLMYLGGNGFYWVTHRHPAEPQMIEIRRGNVGVCTWKSDPGEEHLSGTGEPAGLWRYRGRAPQRLAGVGFTAQGFDKASPYRRSADSRDPAVAWIFDGVEGDVFGDVGVGLGGAAGDELDRADHVLGTPHDTWVLASSFGHSEKVEAAPDEPTGAAATPSPSGIGDPAVRSDIVAFGRPGGGAVFSVGSICWLSAMAYDDGDNAVARITGNVLDRFLAAAEPVPPRR
jgi:N,N-dimethylformamidase